MPRKLSVGRYEEEHEWLIFSGNGIISRGWIYLMNGQLQISEKPLDVSVYSMGKFYDSHGNEIDYRKKILY